jgi:lysophospholipase L1-like esterase
VENIRGWEWLEDDPLKKQIVAGIILSLTAINLCRAAASSPPNQKIEDGAYVAIVGDSITEQKQYSVFIEDYLLMCKPARNLHTTQFGWSGETSWGFERRMENDMLQFHCTAATTCFGMNDGGYSPETPEKEKQYHDAQTSIVEKMKKGGVGFIVVGSPSCVDTDSFRHNPELATMYNKTLATERDIARKVAEEQGVAFADVFDPMVEVMEKAKAKYGHGYNLAGNDGVHPDANGHLVMAYAFLKGLGCGGDVGTITVDVAANKADATDGHTVRSFKDGTIEIESSRYPFCFFGDDPRSTSSTRGVLEFLPFNADLNRFTLVVTNAPAGKKLKVTWGNTSKSYTSEELAKGVNLAADFLDNPFSEPFRAVDQIVRQQQNFETPLVKQLIHDLPAYRDAAPDESPALDRIAASLLKKDQALIEASSAAVKPITHSIKIEVEE